METLSALLALSKGIAPSNAQQSGDLMISFVQTHLLRRLKCIKSVSHILPIQRNQISVGYLLQIIWNTLNVFVV